MTRPILFALLYAALGLFANPGLSEPLSDTDIAALSDLREGSFRKLAIHKTARPITDVTYTTKAGDIHKLSDSNGKIRVVNFWATWCAPCREEKPSLDTLQGTLGGIDFEVIAIATGRNTEANIKRFNSEVGIKNLTTNLDPKSKAARAMSVLALPASIILDRDGNEIARLQGGADWTSDSAVAILKRLISASGS